MDGKKEEIHALSFQHIFMQNMGQDNNSHTGSEHNTTSGILGQCTWIGKEKKYTFKLI